jgi:SAM-dependent methyltransferase
MASSDVIVIIYTTLYRKGGEQFPVVARTLALERGGAGFGGEIIARAVESKRDVLKVIAEITSSGRLIRELHFVGHSGMYGPMFGTVAFPEQFSPYEWETMTIPFAPDAVASFHCCRSARWFAPFFARTFGVTARGFFWYTTFSLSPVRYRWAGSGSAMDRLYTIGCKGRKSHGPAASLQKFLGLMPAEQMKTFEPQPPSGDPTYNRVADLYDAAFADITVRRDEWEWIERHLPDRNDLTVLDIGCGNGALLQALAPRITRGAGVDESAAILERARIRNAENPGLEFHRIDSPSLPFPDGTFDVVISLMSFRYLDWDPLLKDVKRVTKPGGRFLIVDMVTVPVKTREYPTMARDTLRAMLRRRANGEFRTNLRRLVESPDWKKMLEYNPIRSEHEMKWYLESRFPGHRMEILNLGRSARIVAFDSGPVERGVEAQLTYP